jgi:hypothetical protein
MYPLNALPLAEAIDLKREIERINIANVSITPLPTFPR